MAPLLTSFDATTPSAPPEEADPNRVSPINHEDADAELARKLQQELDDEALARSMMSQHQQHSLPEQYAPPRPRVNDFVPTVARITPVTTSTTTASSSEVSDEALARKLAQEMQDEELARQLTVEDQRRLAAARGTPREPARKCTLRTLCAGLVGVALAIGVLIGILYAFSGGNLKGFNPDFQQNDPFRGVNDSDIRTWKTRGVGGLSLEVVNALDTKWYTQFNTAVSEWDNGTPDALTLTTSITSPDVSCDPIPKKLKVCNGDYGNTQWVGINEVLIENTNIVSSVARMNEYYLKSADDAQRQYTMCHEIGHGFGLPHTDENFYNKDQGNCLDYSVTPSANEHPGTVNYELLARLYGTVGSSGNNSNNNSNSDANITFAPTAAPTASNANGGNRRGLLRHVSSLDEAAPALAEPLPRRDDYPPAWVYPAMSRALRRWHDSSSRDKASTIRLAENADQQGWTLLHQSKFGQGHELQLGDGYSVQVHVLFPMVPN